MQKDHLEVILEDMNSKFDLVLEGHAALDRKIDTKFAELSEKVEFNSVMISALNNKIDGVATDLKAHRADTEAHQKIYQVRES